MSLTLGLEGPNGFGGSADISVSSVSAKYEILGAVFTTLVSEETLVTKFTHIGGHDHEASLSFA